MQEKAEQVDQADPHDPRLFVGKLFSGILAIEPLEFVDMVLLEGHAPQLTGQNMRKSMWKI